MVPFGLKIDRMWIYRRGYFPKRTEVSRLFVRAQWQVWLEFKLNQISVRLQTPIEFLRKYMKEPLKELITYDNDGKC